MIRVPVPAEWLYYTVNPHTFQLILKRIDLPPDLPNDVRVKLVNVEIPLVCWTGCDDVEHGPSRLIHFVFDDSDAEFAALFKLTFM